MSKIEEQALRALQAYPHMEHPRLTVLSGGLMNVTFQVEASGGRYVLQSLNAIFRPEVHEDIETVTAHLAKKAMPTTRLVRTTSGALYTEIDGVFWRVLTYVPGAQSFPRMQDVVMANEAGRLVGRFHAAVSDLDYTFKFMRLSVHETPVHMRTLEQALIDHKGHRYYDRIAPLGEAIIRAWAEFVAPPPTKKRLVHGDLKLSNLLFDEKTGTGVCLIDLDTLAYMPLQHELGDAWRSWCNPVGEDSTQTRFDLALFRASVVGYMSTAKAFLTREEVDTLSVGSALIALELSARFCADALRESYFGWDAQKYPDRSTHNLERAQGQFNLFKSIRAQHQDIEAILHEAFAK